MPRYAFLDGSIHVDHIFSKKRAERTRGMGYVRVALARGDVNSTFGRNWELNDERNYWALSTLSADGLGSLEEKDWDAAPQPIWPPKPISLGSYGLMRHINWPMATKAFDIQHHLRACRYPICSARFGSWSESSFSGPTMYRTSLASLQRFSAWVRRGFHTTKGNGACE